MNSFSYKRVTTIVVATILTLSLSMCQRNSCHEQMLELLSEATRIGNVSKNSFAPEPKLVYMDSMLHVPGTTPAQKFYCQYLKANILMELGREQEAVLIFEELATSEVGNETQLGMIFRDLSIAYVRQGERANCLLGHSAESCLLPLRGSGVHTDRFGSQRAIEHYQKVLEKDPNDLESRWLLNLAYMTLGGYPANVPAQYLIPGMEGDTTVKVKPFEDIAGQIGIDINNMAGGSIIDDFDNDGFLDIVTSSMELTEKMHYFHNEGNGTFADWSERSKLSTMGGGLNMIQADYDNDGDRDILVLRGAWKGMYGREPNSLIENNGDGTFKDVTTVSGILSFHPTQTGTWNDFNNDGWLDLFIGNESSMSMEGGLHMSELYMSNGDKTFTNVASAAGVDVMMYVKGVTSGDYNNDGWQDIFISTMSHRRILFKNLGIVNGQVKFKDVSDEAGLLYHKNESFTTWFWDYDNDGWLDIFVCDYTFTKTLAFYAAAEKLGFDVGKPDKILLYRNNHNGTFTNIAPELGLNKVTFSMGGNFGDIDNDGFLDIYAGTGNPNYKSLVPNKMYKNQGGKAFADVTYSARVGHLQKGHGVSFADLDHDGDEDIFEDMGGAFAGDSYPSAFYLNPGQNDENNWVSFELQGVQSNKDGIGARMELTIVEDGVKRKIYRDMNTGGSFGASPLRKHIGIGKAQVIEELSILWPGMSTPQRFTNITANQYLLVKQGALSMEVLKRPAIMWQRTDPLCEPESVVPMKI